jgi:hypothetical protein
MISIPTIVESDVLPSTIRSNIAFGSTVGFQSTNPPSTIFDTTLGNAGRIHHTLLRCFNIEDVDDSYIPTVAHNQHSLGGYGSARGFNGFSSLISQIHTDPLPLVLS